MIYFHALLRAPAGSGLKPEPKHFGSIYTIEPAKVSKKNEKGLVLLFGHYTSSNREKYSSRVIPAVLILFLMMKTGTSFQPGIMTGLATPGFVYTK